MKSFDEVINEEASSRNIESVEFFWKNIIRKIQHQGYPINIKITKIEARDENGTIVPRIIDYEIE
jgi:hypothetical protein